MGGFVPTPEQYRMVMQRRQEEESLAKKAGRAARTGANLAGGLVAGEAARLTDPIKRTAAIAGQAAGDFSAGFGGEPEAEDDPVMRYIEKNPQMASGARGFLMDTAKPYTPAAPHPQTNITAQPEADNKQKWMESEVARRTIREIIGENGKKTYTNQGNEGRVVMQNGEPVGPDIGKPGRGGVSSPATGTNPMDDPAYRNYRANLYGSDQAADDAKAESERKLFEILQRNPFAREAIMSQMQERQQQSAIDRTYGQERAKQGAKLEALSQLDAEEQEMLTELNADPRSADPNFRAQFMQKIQDWRQRQEVALGMRDRMDAAV